MNERDAAATALSLIRRVQQATAGVKICGRHCFRLSHRLSFLVSPLDSLQSELNDKIVDIDKYHRLINALEMSAVLVESFRSIDWRHRFRTKSIASEFESIHDELSDVVELLELQVENTFDFSERTHLNDAIVVLDQLQRDLAHLREEKSGEAKESELSKLDREIDRQREHVRARLNLLSPVAASRVHNFPVLPSASDAVPQDLPSDDAQSPQIQITPAKGHDAALRKRVAEAHVMLDSSDPKVQAAAIPVLEDAAANGSAVAAYVLALAYQYGQGVDPDETKADIYYKWSFPELTAGSDSAGDAFVWLAKMYEHGHGRRSEILDRVLHADDAAAKQDKPVLLRTNTQIARRTH